MANLPERFLVWGTLLDTPIPFELPGHKAVLKLPAANEYSENNDSSQEFSTHFMSRGEGDDPKDRAYVVPNATLSIESDLDYLVSDFAASDEGPSGSRWDELSLEFSRLWRLGQDFLLELLTLTRTTPGQHLLGPASRKFTLLIARIYDREGNQFPTSASNPSDLWGLEKLEPLGRDGLTDLIDDVRLGKQSDLADTLMADAMFTLLSSGDARLAVLQAAMSAERRIKTFLQDHANESQKALVEVILNNPRDVSVSAVGLYDKGLEAVTGRSLREDDKKSFKQLSKLFEQRNAFAHRGGPSLDRITALEMVRAARTAGEYLSDLGNKANHPNSPNDEKLA